MWASELCISVDECTRSVGGVPIPTGCVYATYGTYTLMHASYGVSILTDAHSREPTNGDGLTQWRRLETVCVRWLHVQTECLHDATVCLHPDKVCVHKSVTTHARARVYMWLYDILTAARTWFLPLGLYVLVRALIVRMFHTGLPNSLFQFEVIYIPAVKLTRIAWFSAISPSILNRFSWNFCKGNFSFKSQQR